MIRLLSAVRLVFSEVLKFVLTAWFD